MHLCSNLFDSLFFLIWFISIKSYVKKRMLIFVGAPCMWKPCGKSLAFFSIRRRLMKTIWGNYKLALLLELYAQCSTGHRRMDGKARQGAAVKRRWRRRGRRRRAPSSAGWANNDKVSGLIVERGIIASFTTFSIVSFPQKNALFIPSHNGASDIISSQNRAPVCWKAHSIFNDL